MELSQILTALNVTLADLGVDKDADEATVLTALGKHQSKPEVPENHVVLSQETVKQLTADATAGAAAAEELRVDKFERAFTLCQESGKLVPAQHDSFKELYDLNGEKTLKVMDDLTPVVPMMPAGAGGAGTDLTEAGRALAGEFSDSITPLNIDNEQMRLHAAAVELQNTKDISYEKALQLAEAGVAA